MVLNALEKKKVQAVQCTRKILPSDRSTIKYFRALDDMPRKMLQNDECTVIFKKSAK